ncbi:MAG TPA: S-layer homology domain-containing protein [Anaerolineales bacterium]|nr:S-layer homology domain-containing protein [Anaerolineales bacterium]
MNIRRKQLSRVQGLINILMALGLVSMLLGPGGTVQAQEELPAAPLAHQLQWSDLGTAERTFEVNGEAVTLSGTAYVPSQAFNLESSEDVSAFYATPNLEKLGWKYISTAPASNGVVSVYFHSDGVYALVELVECGDEMPATCVTVWESTVSDIVPAPAGEERAEAQALGTLGKSSPANGATGVNTNLNISWTSYTGTNLNRYRYCIDESNNSQCDASGGWTAVFGRTNTDVSGLEPNTRYYWQVQAVLSDTTKVDANSGSWWSFTTRSETVPGSFAKTVPANGAGGQSITPTLAWQANSRATSYEYCVDTINNNVCDGTWVSTTSTYATIQSGININVVYYWQVRAVNSGGKVEANGGTWYAFATAAAPTNDKVDTALTASIPYESFVNTTTATLDTGTVNACSPALGLASVWYKYTATSNRKIYIDTFGTPYNTFIAVWTRNLDGSLNPVTCVDDSHGTQQTIVNLAVSSGTTYYIQVAQRNASAPITTPGGDLYFHITSFGDVPGISPYWKSIEGFYAAGLSGGCSTSPELYFCPAMPVDRAQMAVFLLRAKHGSNYVPPAVGGTTGFTDVPTDHWAAAWIKQLAAEGITAGCGSGLFCPNQPVDRAQMAVFLLRAKHGSNYVPPAMGGTTGFTDVPTDHWAAAWIKQLAAEGITAGCGPGVFCPATAVSREQMAVFISNAFNISRLP